MKIVRNAALFLLTSAAVMASPVVLAQAGSTPVIKKTSATYRCDRSPSGECAFLLYSSTCLDGPLKNGHAVLLCTHEFLAEFSLKVGESRTMEDLPTSVKQCGAPPDAKPRFPDCAR
ncbi:hypothetical protein [Massilia varians]|uniref:hypothetical protein n=1 Tax=Massilia varians TaxID=457921 RepID=UPI00249143E7|nr:hypothetical protein [Massilia varians]